MNDNLHQRLALYSTLDCQVARRFNNRPTLLDAAAHLLEGQWRERGLGSAFNPLSLFLASYYGASHDAWVRPLQHVLVERYCQRKTLNLNPGDDILTTRLSGDPAWAVDLDLHKVELLINETAPLLIDVYKQLLVDYWTRFDSSGQTPWAWYAGYLQQRMQQILQRSHRDSQLSAFTLATANLVQGHPTPEQRANWNKGGLTVSHLSVDFSVDDQLDADLASAVLIEHSAPEPARNFALLYTLSGRLLTYPSRQALLQALARSWPAAALASPHRVSLSPATDQVFETQALGLLQQQLRVIDHLVVGYRSKLDAINLSLDLDRLSALIDLCDSGEATRRQPLIEQLPDWLRQAQSKPLMDYSTLLVDVAQAYQDSNGQFWLDGIDSAESFANRLFSARFALDHPEDELLPEHVRVINWQTIAAAAAHGDIVLSGQVDTVEYSLAQLAIGNLGLLKPGRVELHSSTGESLPDWMNEAYLRQLVNELDIGSRYPAMLRSKLLDDPEQQRQRQQLLSRQLRSQLPALAMELYLQGKLPDQAACRHVAEVFSSASDEGLTPWVLRPLGLVKAPGSSPDHPRNTWLIEPRTPGISACLLYRPLHEDTLLYFADRLALFVAISTTGPLQDDLLQRLPAEVRRFYAHGGFLEPHLGVQLEDSPALSLVTPAPVSLAVEDPPTDPGKALYLACVNESIQRFEAHATTSSQTRWNSWKELGWLLFNTLLPLAGSTLGKVAWLAQIEVALAEYVSSDDTHDPQGHQLAMVNLLVNIAMLLFTHSIFRLRLEQGEEPAPPPGQPTLPAHLKPAVAPLELHVTTAAEPALDFGWSRPNTLLTANQASALAALQATLLPVELKTPIASGVLQGLYLHDNAVYTRLDGKVYEVALDNAREQMRIIGPGLQPGPWLRRDEVGRWQLDLRLRLEGGMPLNRRIEALRRENLEQRQALASQVAAANAQYQEQLSALTATAERLDLSEDTTELKAMLARMETLASYWERYRQGFEQLNAQQAHSHYKTIRAELLQNACLARQSIHLAIKKLYDPMRRQLLTLLRHQQRGAPLAAADRRIAGQRLGDIDGLMDKLISSQQLLEQQQELLKRLKSRGRADIDSQHDASTIVSVTAKQLGRMHYMRLEALRMRLRLVTPLQGSALYWLERAWDNLLLGITQRERSLALEDAGDELKVRLLRSNEQQFLAVKRCLANLADQALEATQRTTLAGIGEDVRFFLDDLTARLAELPDYPPSRTLAQLRQQQPGLIEVGEQGLLLGDPRQDDPGMIDMPGLDDEAPARAYREGHNGWEEVPAAAQPQAASASGQAVASGKSLKRLLKESGPLIAKANKEARRIEAQVAGSYTPGEIQELLDHECTQLREQINAIETRLTEDNQSDEASQGVDAASAIGQLDELATQLQDKIPLLRKRAALAQPPGIANIEYLHGLHEIHIETVGTRTRLAKVKGRAADYLDEYSISHQGRVLWYAHFHYPAVDSAKADFVSGHLKTAAQRLLKGGGVYYSPVPLAAARRYFFNE